MLELQPTPCAQPPEQMKKDLPVQPRFNPKLYGRSSCRIQQVIPENTLSALFSTIQRKSVFLSKVVLLALSA